jgi:hypothetical protein
MQKKVHSSIICNNPKLETAHPSINYRREKQMIRIHKMKYCTVKQMLRLHAVTWSHYKHKMLNKTSEAKQL